MPPSSVLEHQHLHRPRVRVGGDQQVGQQARLVEAVAQKADGLVGGYQEHSVDQLLCQGARVRADGQSSLDDLLGRRLVRLVQGVGRRRFRRRAFHAVLGIAHELELEEKGLRPVCLPLGPVCPALQALGFHLEAEAGRCAGLAHDPEAVLVGRQGKKGLGRNALGQVLDPRLHLPDVLLLAGEPGYPVLGVPERCRADAGDAEEGHQEEKWPLLAHREVDGGW